MRLLNRSAFPFLVAVCLGSADAFAAPPSHIWSQRFGGTAFDGGKSIAVDLSGNVIVAGAFEGTANFGDLDLVSAGGSDVFIAKYDPDGLHVWSRRFGGTLGDGVQSVAVDGGGNVVAAGSFSGTANFGGSDFTSAGNTDIFIVRLDASGVHSWSKAFGNANQDHGYAVAVDGAGNAVVTGTFEGTVNFGGGNLMSAGFADVFLASYDPAGAYRWSRRGGAADGNDIGWSCAVDGAGNVLAAGSFQGTADFGGGSLMALGGGDIFVAKYDANGVHQWSKRFGGTSSETTFGIAADHSNNVLVTGTFVGTSNFGGVDYVSAGVSDMFVAKYTPAGAHVWSYGYGGTSTEECYSIVADAADNVIVAGTHYGTVDFGGGNMVSAGNLDAFVVMFDAGGAYAWSRQFGSTADDLAQEVAVGGASDIVSTGSFRLTVDFGDGGLLSAGLSDVFVTRYGDASTGSDHAPRAGALAISAFPNPFNPTTTISFTLPASGRVLVTIHDVRGVRVATLFDAVLEAGGHSVPWQAGGAAGEVLGSGVYFVRVEQTGVHASSKLVLLK